MGGSASGMNRNVGYTRGGPGNNFIGNGQNAGQMAFQPQGNAYGFNGQRPPQAPQIEDPGLPPYDPNVSTNYQPPQANGQNGQMQQDPNYQLRRPIRFGGGSLLGNPYARGQ